MAELIVEAESGSNAPVGKSTVDYTSAHDAASGSIWYNAIAVGQTSYISGGGGGVATWEVYRSLLVFDTSSLPDNAVISSVVLSLYNDIDFSDTDFDVVVVLGTDIDDPPVLADYGDILDDTSSRGSINTSTLTLNAFNDISLNATGIAEISLTGKTKFALRSSRDISPTNPGNPPPTYSEYVEFSTASTANQKPKLTITYTFFIPKVIII